MRTEREIRAVLDVLQRTADRSLADPLAGQAVLDTLAWVLQDPEPTWQAINSTGPIVGVRPHPAPWEDPVDEVEVDLTEELGK